VLGLAAAWFVLAAIRDRVGANVTNLVIEYFEQVRNAATDDLTSRICQAADPDVIYAAAGMAADVATAAEGRKLLLSLDNTGADGIARTDAVAVTVLADGPAMGGVTVL
jgi:hypothetical protein